MRVYEYRYRIYSMFWDVVLAAFLSLFPAALFVAAVAVSFLDSPKVPEVYALVFLGSWGGWWLATVIGFAWTRWASFLRISDEGIAHFRSRSRPRAEIGWDELEEVRTNGRGWATYRSGRRRIEIENLFRNPYEARARAWRLAEPALQERAEEQVRERGMVSFHMPGRALVGHFYYFFVVLVLTAVTMPFVYYLVSNPITHVLGGAFGLGIVALIVYFPLRALRRDAGWYSGWVALSAEGVLVHRLDGERWIPWNEVRGVSIGNRGDLVVWLHANRSITLPQALGNLRILERIITETTSARRTRVD